MSRKPRSLKVAVLGGGVLAALSCVSCSTPPAPPLHDLLGTTKGAAKPLPYRLMIADVNVDEQAATRPPASDSGWSPVPVDLAGVQEGVARAVRASRTFNDPDQPSTPRSSRIPDAPDRTDLAETWSPERRAFDVAPKPSREFVLDQAFRAKADLVLEVEVRKHNVAYDGWESGSVHFWELVLDFLLAFPQWWIANELYRADVEVEARLLSVGTRAVVWSNVFRPQEVAPVRLSSFDRGIAWLWLDSFVVPTNFTLENYARAGQHALPYAWNSIFQQLARDLATAPFAIPEEELAKTLVLSIGVGEQEHRVPDLDVPNKDATQFSRLLQELGGLPEEHVIELTGARATRATILASLAELSSRLNHRDTLIVYYAGYGFALGPKAHLVPYDFEPERSATTGLALEELSRVLDGAAGTQAIILDTSFAGGEEGTRTLPSTRVGLDAPDGDADATPSFERLAQGRSVLLAARPAEAVSRQSFDAEDKAGMFTARFLRAAASTDLDRNNDGWLDLTEVFERAKRDTRELSSLVGRSQHPTWLGQASTVRLTRNAKDPR